MSSNQITNKKFFWITINFVLALLYLTIKILSEQTANKEKISSKLTKYDCSEKIFEPKLFYSNIVPPFLYHHYKNLSKSKAFLANKVLVGKMAAERYSV